MISWLTCFYELDFFDRNVKQNCWKDASCRMFDLFLITCVFS